MKNKKTIDDWSKVYYKTDAFIFSGKPVTIKNIRAALVHSITKWTGLLPRALDKYNMSHTQGLYVTGLCSEGFEDSITIDSESCALCQLFSDACNDCIFTEANGHQCCSAHRVREFDSWHAGGSPKPMLKSLRKALKYVDNKIAKKKKK